MSDDANLEPNAPVNILCLDGGGARGLSSLLILRRIMRELSIILNKEDIAPWQVFDLICGTSTGGIIAILIGRLRMTVQEAITAYLALSKDIFRHKDLVAATFERGGKSLYDHQRLETAIQKIIKDNDLSRQADAKMEDPHRDGTACRVCVLGVDQSAAQAPTHRFRTYVLDGADNPSQYMLWQAVRATTAALPFFDPVEFLDPPRTFVDAALGGVNNPTNEAIDEARQIWPNRSIGCLLSIGTGEGKILSISQDDLAKSLMKINMSCKQVANQVGSRYRKVKPNPYIRLSVDRGLEGVLFDEWEKMDEMTGITEAYLRYEDQKEKAKKCVDLLAARSIEEGLR